MGHLKKKVLLMPSYMLIIGTLIAYLQKKTAVVTSDIIFIVAASFLFFLISWGIKKYNKNIDEYILSLVIFLCSMSLIMLLRLKVSLFKPQMEWICLGMVLMLLTIVFSAQLLKLLEYPYLLGLASILIIFLVVVFGTEIGGNRNWIIMGPFQVQPSEYAKLLVLGFLTAYLQENKNLLNLPNRKWGFLYLPPLRFLAPLIMIWSMALLMFVYQRDLGSALLFFGMAVMMTYVATSNKSYMFLAAVFFILSGFASYMAFGHVRVRFDIWLNPWADPMGKAYQIVQSLFALGYGGLFGAGYWHGFPDMIPAVQTDFIFSAIGEEFGLLGVLSVITAYLLIFFRAMKISFSCSDEKYKLLSFGLSATMLLQAFIILAGVTKLLPLTGITLPFISYGGSSMTASFITIGLLLAIGAKEKNRA